jgi:purine-binding chemotaxis protein CheW
MSGLFLIAQIAGRTVAIDSSQVESVVDITTVVPVPRTLPQVLGLAALRSRVVTVIDTHAALNLPPAERPATRAVITPADGHYYAVLVDSLEDVAPFDLLPLASGIVLDGGWGAAGCGIIERAGEPVLVIDLRALLPGVVVLAA